MPIPTRRPAEIFVSDRPTNLFLRATPDEAVPDPEGTNGSVDQNSNRLADRASVPEPELADRAFSPWPEHRPNLATVVYTPADEPPPRPKRRTVYPAQVSNRLADLAFAPGADHRPKLAAVLVILTYLGVVASLVAS